MSTFDHRAHLELAWEAIDTVGLIGALNQVPPHLEALARESPGKYHTTVTWAFLLLVGERYRSDEGFDRFIRRNLDLSEGVAVLDRYYDSEQLRSAEARHGFVLPLRAPEAPPA